MMIIELLIFINSLLFILITFVICIREILVVYYNPLPKMDDNEKDLSTIKFIKTRTIK